MYSERGCFRPNSMGLSMSHSFVSFICMGLGRFTVVRVRNIAISNLQRVITNRLLMWGGKRLKSLAQGSSCVGRWNSFRISRKICRQFAINFSTETNRSSKRTTRCSESSSSTTNKHYIKLNKYSKHVLRQTTANGGTSWTWWRNPARSGVLRRCPLTLKTYRRQ